SSVIENVRYTNRYREKHAVNTSACSLRRRPSPAGISPRYPKSTCSSPPGGPSSTGVVTLLPPAPHRSAANRCSVRSATTTPCRPSKIPIFTTGTPPSTHAAICCRRPSSSAHPAPCPSGRTGRTTDTTCPISSSVSWSSPPPRDRPAATAAATYRLLVLRSTPACAATARSLFPASQALSASRTSITDTSRNTIPATSSRSTGEDQTGMTPDKRRTTPLVQLLATGWSHAHGGKPLNMVPCRWRMTTAGGKRRSASSGGLRQDPGIYKIYGRLADAVTEMSLFPCAPCGSPSLRSAQHQVASHQWSVMWVLMSAAEREEFLCGVRV